MSDLDNTESFFFQHDELVPEQSPTVRQVSVHNFEGLSQTIHVSEDAAFGCGGKTWEAANVMIDHLIWRYSVNANEFEGTTILELGSGTGLVGLCVAALVQNVKVITTDQFPMLELMRKNVNLNSLTEKMEVMELNWGEDYPKLVTPDIIIGSDCIYLETAFQPLVETLANISNNNTRIFLSYKRRRKADKRFFGILKKKFDYVKVKNDPHYQNFSREGLYLYQLFKK